jgi:hypothetical protein
MDKPLTQPVQFLYPEEYQKTMTPQTRIIKNMLVGDRGPDEVINDDINGTDVPYLLRWFVRKGAEDGNRIYLHCFMRSDYERALHDHTSQSTSIILQGGYIEHMPDEVVCRREGDIIVRSAYARHRVELLNNQVSWSLFLLGPKVRDWGFYCQDGWKPWREVDFGKC